MNTAILLQELKKSSILLLDDIIRISEQLETHQLEVNDGVGRWNILQVLEHLNSYYAYYLPLIETKTKNAGNHPQQDFKPGWLGAYFTQMMQPKDGVIRNKMKAFRNHVPNEQLSAQKVIEEFLQFQRKLIYLLQLAENKDLNAIRIPISLSPFIKLKLGDTFSFIVAHNNRHRKQIENILAFNNINVFMPVQKAQEA